MSGHDLASLAIRVLEDGRVALDVNNRHGEDAKAHATTFVGPNGRAVLVVTFSTYVEDAEIDPETGDVFIRAVREPSS